MEQKNATYDLWERCQEAINSNADQEIIEGLFAEAKGYKHIMRTMRCDALLNDHSINGLRALAGWLAFHMDNMGYAKPVTNINNSAKATASVRVDLSVTIEAIESSDLTEDQIKELKALMLDLSAAQNKDAKTVAEKLRNALDVAKSSAGAAKAVMEFAIPIIQSIL